MKRLFLPILFITLFLGTLSACSTSPRSVTFNHVTYTFQDAQDKTERFTAPDGQTLQIEPLDDSTQVIVNGQTYLTKGTENDFTVTFPDGRELSKHYEENASTGSTGMDTPTTLQDWDQVDDIHEIVFHTIQNRQNNAHSQRLLIGAVLFGIGLLQVAKPRLAWQISEGWRYKNLEPSELYLGLSRLAGVVLMLVALFVAFEQ